MIQFSQDLLTTEPLVSVVIITYNQENYIQETISSILNQRVDFNFEIILAEDCSTDNTRNICISNYQNNQNRIKLILQEENVGLLQNYKDALSICRGKYIAQCAGDDFWFDLNKMNTQVSLLETNSEIGLVHSNYYVQRGGEISLYEQNKICIEFSDLLIHNHICAATVMFKSSVISDFFSFLGDDYYSFMMEDYPLWLYISKYHKIGFIQEPMVVYRQLPVSVSNIVCPKKDIVFQMSVAKIKRYFIESFHVDRNLIKEQMHEFYISAIHVCYAERMLNQYYELKNNVLFWKIELKLLNKLRLYSLKNKYIHQLVVSFFYIKRLLC